MSKKVGIITIVKVNNYGAELQAFATQKALQQMGYDAEIIDYLFYKNPRHKATRKSKPFFDLPFKKRLAEWLYPKITYVRRKLQRNEDDEIRRLRFEHFHLENTRFSKEYRTIESLYAEKMDYDAYIVGSDQVWNPNNYTSLDPYFLKFAPKDKVRLSYASSIGLSSLPEDTKAYYRDAFNGLDAISVREENATKIVEEVSGKQAKWVLDPTLLLNKTEWLQFATKVEGMPEHYVLIYEITPCAYVKKLARYIAEETGCKVVRINREAVREESDDEVVNVMYAGPAEFLWLFAHASAVVTNSFHGTAFSLNMNKYFYVVTPARKQNNSRQKSLLKLVDLEDRLLVEDSPMPALEKFHVDYHRVNILLDAEREKSKNFLKTAIDGK